MKTHLFRPLHPQQVAAAAWCRPRGAQSVHGKKRESVQQAMSRLKAGQGERAHAEHTAPDRGRLQVAAGLQAVNQASNNLVRRSTNEPLSAIKEDTGLQTIARVNCIV